MMLFIFHSRGSCKMRITKRSGAEVDFDIKKIVDAISKANGEADQYSRLTKDEIESIAHDVMSKCVRLNRIVNVEEIQDMVENGLMDSGHHDVARKYITYRYDRSENREMSDFEKRVFAIADNKSESQIQENANKNVIVESTKRDAFAGELSREMTRKYLLPKDVVQAHDEGRIHVHDTDYFLGHIHNCELINLEDMLQNGTVINNTMIESPDTFSTAATVTSQIILHVSANSFGGLTFSLAHLCPFMDKTRRRFRKRLAEWCEKDEITLSDAQFDALVEDMTRRDVVKGLNTIQYQQITLQNNNGQSAFCSEFMYMNEVPEEQKADMAFLIEQTLRLRYQGVKDPEGNWVNPTFPKLLYVLEDDNVHPGDRFYYLTELAVKCSAKQMVPDYISEKVMLENKIDANGEGHCYPCMGCRSFLTPYIDENGKPKYYGRYNFGVTSADLAWPALEARGDFDKFWKLLDETCELCHKALLVRYSRLAGITSDSAPILWQYGALARLKPGEEITPLLHGGYATVSLGYAGLYECVKAMTGKSHTDPEGFEFAKQVLQFLNDKCKEWKAAENKDYSVYGTPIESTTYKFAKCLQKKFGVIEGITDHNYITNSYHVCVTEPINAFDKIEFEAKLQPLSPGGCISYVELPNMSDNLEAVMSVVQWMYEKCMYCELNLRSQDHCKECGYTGEIRLIDEGGDFHWECPKCGNRDPKRMTVIRRICGYLANVENGVNDGRLGDIHDRVLHL